MVWGSSPNEGRTPFNNKPGSVVISLPLSSFHLKSLVIYPAMPLYVRVVNAKMNWTTFRQLSIAVKVDEFCQIVSLSCNINILGVFTET